MSIFSQPLVGQVSNGLSGARRIASKSTKAEAPKKKRSYFPPTSVEQRRLLFETWQKTGNIQEACRIAGVSRTTFYHWRERFLEGGFGALEKPRSNAPHRPRRVAEHIVKMVLEIRRQHSNWGKLRISKEVNRQLGPKSISPNSVMRILMRENLW
ncbi:MAG: helix-turn-helix domain containing protein [Caldilineaceae bacterium]|nr:helix-turn-helix domain containing protein [Caldilineaceae bacterium]MCB0095906.1 helix-turn-helix domain containing protein [Caldilineaceae bacterium]MCB0139340.1 helix-turn-helix domain containing protein [Caldilineaceae bacterium]